MKRAAVGLSIALAMLVACESSDLVIGDDTQPTEVDDSGSPLPDGQKPNGDSGNNADAVSEDAPSPPSACTNGGGTCLVQGTKCRALNEAGATCTKANEFCCQETCPQLAPPSPSFCDGGPIAAKYDTFGCVVGYACAPIGCEEGGGQCVGLTPTACPAPKKFGDATKYSCGGGIGSACCLP
jgi:hypothetical protein